MLLESRVKVFDRLQVAKSNHKAIVVGREGVDRVSLDHVAALGALELSEVREPVGYLHPLYSPEAVLENILLVLEEGEALRTFLDLHLRALFVLSDDKPGV